MESTHTTAQVMIKSEYNNPRTRIQEPPPGPSPMELINDSDVEGIYLSAIMADQSGDAPDNSFKEWKTAALPRKSSEEIMSKYSLIVSHLRKIWDRFKIGSIWKNVVIAGSYIDSCVTGALIGATLDCCRMCISVYVRMKARM